MYKLIFFDSGMEDFGGDMVVCYIDDIWQFTQDWSRQVKDGERIKKFLLSIDGKHVTGNILTGEEEHNREEEETFPEFAYWDGVFLLEDQDAKILQQKIIELKNFSLIMDGTEERPQEFRVRYMKMQVRYVSYQEEYLRLMSYSVQGIARYETQYRKLGRLKNSLIKYEEVSLLVYADDFEEFVEDKVELMAWYPMGYAETLEELQELYGGKNMLVTHQDLEQLFQDFIEK